MAHLSSKIDSVSIATGSRGKVSCSSTITIAQRLIQHSFRNHEKSLEIGESRAIQGTSVLGLLDTD